MTEPEQAEPAIPEPKSKPTPTWLKALLALCALLGPPLAAGFFGLFGAFIMAVMGDAGIKDKAAAEFGFQVYGAGMVLFACCGLPAAVGVFSQRYRSKLFLASGGVAVLGVVAAFVGLMSYGRSL